MIQFEDGTCMRLYRQTVEDFGLYSGKDMDDADISRLRIAAGQMSAKMRAIRIISASSVSKADLEQRLIQKGESRQDAHLAVTWMTELNLLDDQRTAEQLVQRCIAKGYGLSRVKQMLYEKRIPKEFWEEVLSDYPDQSDHILEFFRSRLGDHRDEKSIRRVTDALIRRGHSYQEIRKALNQLSCDADFQEDNYE